MYPASANLLPLSRVCVSEGTMFTLLAGARTFNCNVATFDAVAVPPVGRLKTLDENSSVGLKGSLMAPAVEVAPVSPTADGMVPSRIPFIISSGVYPPRARRLCLRLEFSHGLRL